MEATPSGDENGAETFPPRSGICTNPAQWLFYPASVISQGNPGASYVPFSFQLAADLSDYRPAILIVPSNSERGWNQAERQRCTSDADALALVV